MTEDRIPESQWPKPYLLSILEQAVAQGCIRVGPFARGRAEVKSLIASLNRIRRKKDKAHDSFIRPEYHLVTYTYEEARGTLLVTYNTLPDNIALPGIHSVSPSELQTLAIPQDAKPKLELVQASGPVDTDALIDQLLAGYKSAD